MLNTLKSVINSAEFKAKLSIFSEKIKNYSFTLITSVDFESLEVLCRVLVHSFSYVTNPCS